MPNLQTVSSSMSNVCSFSQKPRVNYHFFTQREHIIPSLCCMQAARFCPSNILRILISKIMVTLA